MIIFLFLNFTKYEDRGYYTLLKYSYPHAVGNAHYINILEKYIKFHINEVQTTALDR